MNDTSRSITALILFVSFAYNSYSQKLILKVESLADPTQITLTKEINNSTTNVNDGEVFDPKNNWSFEIKNPSNLTFTVTLRDESNPANILSIPSSSTAPLFADKNNLKKADGSAFELVGLFSILIKDQASTKKTFKINYTPVSDSPIDKKYTAGYVYYDALYLNGKDSNATTQQQILAYYAGLKSDASADDIKAALADNKYLAGLMDIISQRIRDQKAAGQQSSALPANFSASSMLSSAGGLDVTNIADGFAKFLVKRTKEELNVAFFSKFKEEISKPEFKDLQTVFPQTYRALTAIGEEIYNYESYIQTLRECFEKDLANLITNLPTVIENHPQFFEQQPELRAILESAFYIAQQIEDKQHPGDIIANYPDNLWQKCNPNYQASIQTLQLLSTSLRSKNTEKAYWIGQDEMKVFYTDNKEAFKIYIGLLIQEAKKKDITYITANGPQGLDSLLNSETIYREINNAPIYKDYVKGFVSRAEALEKKLKGLKTVGSDSLLLENYYSFFTSTIDLVKYSVKVEELPHFKDLQLHLREKTEIYIDAAQTSAELVIDINRRNYSSAVVNAFDLLSLVFQKDSVLYQTLQLQTELDNMESKYASDLKELSKKQKSLAKQKDVQERRTITNDIKVLNNRLEPYLTLQNEVKRTEAMEKLLPLFYKYGTFMATVVTAASSDEVAQAIEAFSLPAGSSRIKRETNFSVSLNAYVGGYAGYEQINGKDPDFPYFKFNSYGVTAPIGVAFNLGRQKFFGLPCNKAGHWSYSAFLSVIDLGAIASFRFKDDTTTSQIPTIQLKDIVSPGAFFSVGIPKCPVSLNFGMQIGPNLRTVTAEGNKYENSIYIRYSLSICVDIPIINLYSTGKSISAK